MKRTRLPKRLAAIVNFILPGKVVADIGTDHAYLPVYLVQAGISPKVVATELNEKPWTRANIWVNVNNLKDKIDVRRGEGLQVLSPGEAQVVVVAGMGGTTIKRLLAVAPLILHRLERLILQPVTGAGDLRLWLVDNDWRLVEEALVEEKGRLYVILVAEQGKEATKDRLLVEMGPRLIEKSDPFLVSYLEQLKKNYQRVLNGLALSRSLEAQKKAVELTAKLAKAKELTAQNSFPACRPGRQN